MSRRTTMTTMVPRHWKKPSPRHEPSLARKRTTNIIVHAVGLEKDRGRRLLLSVRACRAYLVSLCYTCNLSYVRSLVLFFSTPASPCDLSEPRRRCRLREARSLCA